MRRRNWVIVSIEYGGLGDIVIHYGGKGVLGLRDFLRLCLFGYRDKMSLSFVEYRVLM